VKTTTLAIAGLLVAAQVSASDAASRIRADADAGKPLVVHVLVALCDNVNQGIVPVPAKLGNGADPDNNLYWGALYGIRGYFSRARGWKRVLLQKRLSPAVLERAVFVAPERGTHMYVVADAWEGSRIRDTISEFLEMASGRHAETVRVGDESLAAGGESHVVAFVGHNGLMNFDAPAAKAGLATPARATIVLACASQPYFEELLRRAEALPLLVTTGLMAPEAYSLEAGLREWFATGNVLAARMAAAAAYARYQRCGQQTARQLFAVGRLR
jgi:hypothetical protein